MKITVNNETIECASSQMLSELLNRLGYKVSSFAVALNDTFVPRSAYDQTSVQEGDRLEIVAPMQGG